MKWVQRLGTYIAANLAVSFAALVLLAFLSGLLVGFLTTDPQNLGAGNTWQGSSYQDSIEVTQALANLKQQHRWLAIKGQRSKQANNASTEDKAMSLVGIVQSKEGQWALLLAANEKQPMRLKVGDSTAEDWVLTAIQSSQVTLQKDDQTQTLRLYANTSVK